MNMNRIVELALPILVAAVGWLLSEVASFNNRLIAIESKMPILLTPEGVIISSPQDSAARQVLKEDLLDKIHDLQVRVKLMEERERHK